MSDSSPKCRAQASQAEYGFTLSVHEESLLRCWLTENLPNPDAVSATKDRWRKIGWEVFERKALLLAASSDLVKNGIPSDDALKLAATDIFVEKAQVALTSRAKQLSWVGVGTSCTALVLLLCGCKYVYAQDPLSILHTASSSDGVSPAYLTVVILRSTTAGGLFLGSIYLLASLSYALFHEATVLYSRRHSLRFGRLFVYLMKSQISREDLEKVFDWNAEFSTAFKSIDAGNVAKSLPGELLKVSASVFKEATELLKTLKKTKQTEAE
jgi:hypothetical protein